MNQLPPDPYLALGVSKVAQLAEIRSAHRKLVLKCHPDKVQDEALKAAKQDEFQKVQQAYELLSDENKRAHYDAQVKLSELRKEMGRGPAPAGPGPGPGPGPNVFYAEPRMYRPKSRAAYPSDVPRYMPPRRPSSYETKPPKSTSKDEERRRRKEDELREELRRQQDREKKREKDAAQSERKKSREKERRKASDSKPKDRYIESDSESEDLRKPPLRSARFKLADAVDMAKQQMHREDRRPDIIDGAERQREKTKAHIQNAYRYMKAAGRGTEPPRSAKPPFVPDSPVVDKIIEEEEPMRRSSGLTRRRSSGEMPTTSRRPNSSRSRESPRVSSSKKRSEARAEDVDMPIRTKPGLFSQKLAPPKVLSSREKPHRSHTVDEKHGSKAPSLPTALPRAATFHGNEQPKSRSVPKQRVLVYESVPESSSESDSEDYDKKPAPLRPRPPMMKTSSYKIVRDSNGQRAAERVRNLDVYEVPREGNLDARHTANYPRPSRPTASRAQQTQSYYDSAASPPFPRTSSPEPQREIPNVKTVRPGGLEAQVSYSRQQPAMYEEMKVKCMPKINRKDIKYSTDFTRGSDPEARYANYPAPNAAYRKEEVFPRKAMYAG